MSEINLGQFIKNVFDYSTGKPVQQQPTKTANENFQRAQNEAMKAIQQTAQNISQNFVRQQDILNTQMMLKELSNVERTWLMKNMFNFPESLTQLLEQVVTQGKTVTPKELSILMSKDLDISKIIILLQTNGKTALDKIAKMIATMNQSGIYDTHQLKEMTTLINACIPVNDASQAQVLKNLMMIYLPWLPINENSNLNFGADSEEEGKKGEGKDSITLMFTTKNYGIVKILLYLENNGCNIDVNCSEEFPKDRFNKALQNENGINVNEKPVYVTRKSETKETAEELKVDFSKTTKVSPRLLVAIHAIIKIITEIDNFGSLQEKRKEEV